MNIWPVVPQVSKVDVVNAFRSHGVRNVKVTVHDWYPFKRVPLIEIEAGCVTDHMPIYTWLRDVPRAAHRIKWIKRRNALYFIMNRLWLLGGRGVERPNKIMRFVGFSDPQIARKEDFNP